jgi:uncharacterized repeat protein (TIGR02543 family)
MVYDFGSQRAYIYINGDRANDNNNSISPPTQTTKPLVIGKENADRIAILKEPHIWKGTLSLLQIHNVALTDQEIKKHDAQCRGILPRLIVTPPSGGTVTGQGINCGTRCQADFANGITVTLRAAPNPGYAFMGWSGDCVGMTPTCQVTMNQLKKTVTATFKPYRRLTVTKNDDGGTVTGPSINCGDLCDIQVTRAVQGSSVTLTATPYAGFLFTWTGACAGTSPSCTVSMTQDQTVNVIFTPATGGTVRSNSCGTPCQVDVAMDTAVSTMSPEWAIYDPATGVLHLPAIEIFGQVGEIEVFQADLVWKVDNSNSWFELVNRQNSIAVAGNTQNAIYDLENNTLKVPFVAVHGSDGTKYYTGELQLIASDPQRFVITQMREIEVP